MRATLVQQCEQLSIFCRESDLIGLPLQFEGLGIFFCVTPQGVFQSGRMTALGGKKGAELT